MVWVRAWTAETSCQTKDPQLLDPVASGLRPSVVPATRRGRRPQRRWCRTSRGPCAACEWLEEQRFLIQRSHYDDPEIPDAIAVTGFIDGKPSMHYFDPRGVHRVLAVDVTVDTWRFWNDAPGFSQRFTHTFSDDNNAINGQAELSTDDGATWERDLAIAYRRIG
jgi:hypothetical protein